jgi:tetratricopeptide (TPR) repeat protein
MARPAVRTPAAEESESNDPLLASLALRAQGRVWDALRTLSAIGEFPSDFYILRGELQLEIGQVREAAGSFFTVVASEPDNVYAQWKLGLCLRRLERWEQAADTFEAALKQDPQRDQVRLDLGDTLLRMNRCEEALRCFDQCWSASARRPALFGMAVAHQLLGRGLPARAAYERLLALDPEERSARGAPAERCSGEALSNLIAISVEDFDLERVWRYSERLLKLNPQSIPALQGLTMAAVERGDYQTAARYFSLVADREPQDTTGASIEYHLSRKVIERLRETGAPGGQHGTLAHPA